MGARLEALVEAQARTDGRIKALVEAQAQTEAQVKALVEAQAQTEARVKALVEAQSRTEARVEVLAVTSEGLTAQMTALTAQMAELVRGLQRNSDDVGKLKGWGLETRFRNHCGAFFGEFVRRAHPLSNDELSDLVEEAADEGKLSDAETVTLMRTDMVVRGIGKLDGLPVYLVVEVSWTVDAYDVEWAAHRAALLAKLGLVTQPVVAGASIRPAAAELAFGLQVRQMIDKEAALPEE